MNRARNVKGSLSAKAVASGAPPLSCAVVSEAEVRHIQDIVDNAPLKLAEDEKSRRERIRQCSEARVAHWPNTIEAQRLRKEQARQERLDREEERRLRIDEEERRLREVQKAQAVQRANILLYEENDKIKNFTSKLFLTTVLEEREKQLAIKEERRRLEKQLELEALLAEQEALRKAEEKEITTAESAKQRTFALKEAQLQQLEEIRQQKIKERDASREEGRRILRGAQDAVREEAAAEEQRVRDEKERTLQLAKINEDQLRLKQEQRAREKEEEERITQFAAAKEQQMLDRKARAEQKFVAKLRARQELIDLQARQLAEIQASNEERELKAMRDFDRERREREQLENEKRNRQQREMKLSREQQLQARAERKAQEAAELQRMKGIWKDRAELLIDEELHERREHRVKSETLQHFHMLQAQEKRQQALRERRADIEEGLQLQNALKEEQEMYNAYVNSVMSEYVAKGRGSDLVRLAASRSKAQSA